MGGNQAGVHHPLAAGRSQQILGLVVTDISQPQAEPAQLSLVMLS